MTIANENSVVRLEYEVKEAGTTEIIEGNKGGDVLEFVMGYGQVVPGLEKALIGMNDAEEGDILVNVNEAYGDINPEALQVLPREEFTGVELIEGMTLYGQGQAGETVQVIVKSFDEKEVHLDFNHPLAGKNLIFSVKVLGVRDATASEISNAISGPTAEEGESCGTGCGCH